MSFISSVTCTKDCRIALIAALFIPCLASSGDWMKEEYGLELNLEQMQGMGLLPIGMMDDASLLAAAEAERNGISIDEQMKMNVFWLLGESASSEKYSKHFKQNLRKTLLEVLQQNDVRLSSDNERSKRKAGFWNSLEPYRVRLRDDAIALNIVVAF